ncbi:MAG: DNA helicase RecQ [Mariniblastus sp.]
MSQTAAVDPTETANNRARLASTLKEFWGFDDFRSQQLDAMQAVMSNRDSVVVFPTGGGKSLCFQAPAVCVDGMAVVVSPLISLMKDQVDALQACGIKAAFWNSSLSPEAEQNVLDQIRLGELQLLYLAPERLLNERAKGILSSAKISFFAIDEAHCVSEWGHDFRPEYRGLSILKTQYPGVAIHAYTATATTQVREDIVRQLGMQNPEVLIGSMDRPNLTYQIRRRESGMGQVVEVIDKFQNESGIVYCISRKNVESTCDALNSLGHNALPYHAGMSAEDRKANQESFLREEAKIIVATVAFGMGIDKSNVRYVIHTGMPKSLEAYQQESGRAGRDGLDSECWMFYNGGDFVTWKRLIEQSESGPGRESAVAALTSVSNFCNGIVCRHVALAKHFGEDLEAKECSACDVCLNDLNEVADPLILAQKIVSCVYRVQQRFGAEYVAQVLIGSREQRILQNKHDELSTYGLLETENKVDIRAWIDQLVSQDFLAKSGEYNVLTITDLGNQLLKSNATPRLLKAPERTKPHSTSNKSVASWEGVDQALFDALREQRAIEASERSVPAYVVFSDNSLRDMARRRPSTLEAFRLINGVGQQKLADFGETFVALINQHCDTTGTQQDVTFVPKPAEAVAAKTVTASALASFKHFDNGLSVEDAAKALGRAASTTRGYLTDYIRHKKITDPNAWVDADAVAKITEVIKQVGEGPLKPYYVALEEKFSYDDIRIVAECLKNESN